MKIHLTVIELWFWRLAIIGLIIYSAILGQGVRQAEYMGVNNIKLIEKTNVDLGDNIKNTGSTLIILQAMAEDYPPKMKIGEREWCLNRVCLKGLGIDE
jgi:hypothetical protein